MKIQVTQQDIALATVGDCIDCPVARAIKRATNCDCEVSEIDVDIYEPDLNSSFQNYHLPSSATRAIAHYDLTGEMLPFDFDLVLEV